jgi:hypothetical protein
MSKRVVIEWNEETARVWWKFGSGSAAPFPGERRSWFAMLREWVMDTIGTVVRIVHRCTDSEVSPLPEFLRIVAPLIPTAVDPPNFRTMCGAASILAPPARPRGAGQSAVMTT